MNTLQEKRTSLGLTQPQVSEALKAVEPHADIGMVSRYERGVCIPTDAQIAALEKLYGAHRADLWDIHDLDLLHMVPEYSAENQGSVPMAVDTPKKDLRSVFFKKMCYRVPRKFAETIPPDIFQVTGYSSAQSWHDACLRRLIGEYAAKCKAMKNKEVNTNEQCNQSQKA